MFIFQLDLNKKQLNYFIVTIYLKIPMEYKDLKNQESKGWKHFTYQTGYYW